MNDKTIELLQDNLPKIADALKTTSELAHDKVTWYIRISGWIEVSGWVLAAIAFVIWHKTVVGLIKKWEVGEVDGPILYFWGILVFVIMLLLGYAIFYGVSNSVMKIVSPDYYIIHQVLNRLQQ